MSIYRIGCSEIWGGVREEDLEARTGGILASLHSSASDGEKGGDVYHISVCSSDLLTRVAIADVAGHGKAASNMGEWLYDSLRARMNSPEGDRVLAELNALLSEQDHTAMTTAAIVSFYGANLYVSYAGHPPMLAYRSTEKCWKAVTLEAPGGGNLPLGAFRNVAYHQERRPTVAGDRFFLYTDGLIEAPDTNGRFFGQQSLLAVLEREAEANLHDLKNAVLDALRRHTGGSLEHDDVTFMALEVQPEGCAHGRVSPRSVS